MPRRTRQIVAGGVYHVYARGNRRQAIFADDEDRRRYLGIWGDMVRNLGWRCLAYCLMDNHVHHVVEVPGSDLSDGVRIAHSSYGRYYNAAHGLVGHTFEARFGSSLATTSATLRYFVGYVVLNPVRAGMCASPEQHPWSSHAATIGAAERPHWLDTQRLLAAFDSGTPSPLDRYVEIVEVLRTLGAAGFERTTAERLDRAPRTTAPPPRSTAAAPAPPRARVGAGRGADRARSR